MACLLSSGTQWNIRQRTCQSCRDSYGFRALASEPQPQLYKTPGPQTTQSSPETQEAILADGAICTMTRGIFGCVGNSGSPPARECSAALQNCVLHARSIVEASQDTPISENMFSGALAPSPLEPNGKVNVAESRLRCSIVAELLWNFLEDPAFLLRDMQREIIERGNKHTVDTTILCYST